jgi:hypothetical protein
VELLVTHACTRWRGRRPNGGLLRYYHLVLPAVGLWQNYARWPSSGATSVDAVLMKSGLNICLNFALFVNMCLTFKIRKAKRRTAQVSRCVKSCTVGDSGNDQFVISV